MFGVHYLINLKCLFFLKCLLSVLRRGSLKDLLVRAKVPVEKKNRGKSCGCQGKCCKVCTFSEEKKTFTNKEGSYTYKLREGLYLDCNSKNVNKKDKT